MVNQHAKPGGGPTRRGFVSAWRRKTCGDLTACFDFEGGVHGFPSLPEVNRDVFRQFASEALRGPGIDSLVTHPQAPPRQEGRPA